ncbi:MAG: DUF1579 domain-containing protein [Planctomycetota bacterium]
MKSFMGKSLFALLLVFGTSATSDEVPEFPKPEKEHQWLQRLVGEWEYEAEMFMKDKPPVKAKGEDHVRSLGGFWILSEQKSEMFGVPFTGLMTLGYDASKKKFVGTWVDSMSGNLWNYQGTLDAGGKVLTLETEGFCPAEPGRISAFKEVIEVKDDNHRVFTSSVQGSDGQWTTMVKLEFQRKK